MHSAQVNSSISTDFHKQIVYDLIKYIDLMLIHGVKARDVAAKSGYTSGYLSAMFRYHTGLDLCKYIVKCRQEKIAQEYLNGTSAMELRKKYHIDSIQTLCSSFKRYHGLSFKEYRQRHQQRSQR